MKNLIALIVVVLSLTVMQSQVLSQMPPPSALEPGVSQELAKWRAERYSDVRYKLNLTLEKMSPVLKGTIEIRVTVGAGTLLSPTPQGVSIPPIILDWRKIKGHEEKSTVSNVMVNGVRLDAGPRDGVSAVGDKSVPAPYEEINEHLVFSDGVVAGENVIKLDFTSPILTSGSAITRYIDKEDGNEYIYSLFVPSDASTAFPVFDQPDLKAKFKISASTPLDWKLVTNEAVVNWDPRSVTYFPAPKPPYGDGLGRIAPEFIEGGQFFTAKETKPISTYVFAFAAGPFERVADKGGNLSGSEGVKNAELGVRNAEKKNTLPTGRVSASDVSSSIYVRKSQAEKFKPHAAEVFRLNRESVKFFEEYFDYKFPFPKYDLVLIPEFPFGGMEHAGATFLRESSIIFPQEPTKNDHISRAVLIFHEAAHQWFGDTVTMRWFDDLWLKEGFANFAAYKAMEKIMPEANAWKVFYERIKQGAYATDSTKGTTPIYQEIKNLSAAKSAYGNIVYNKAPAFLRQAEFYLSEDKFQTSVRAFLKKHEFGNAGWEDLVKEFELSSTKDLKQWANVWVKLPSVPKFRNRIIGSMSVVEQEGVWELKYKSLGIFDNARTESIDIDFTDRSHRFDWRGLINRQIAKSGSTLSAVLPNYQDYGYGIFLLDEKSRDYVLKNIQSEKDPFLRSMMWGALWDSVREGELDPREYVELVVRVLSTGFSRQPHKGGTQNEGEDESTTALLLNRVGTAMNYYIEDGVSSPQVSKGSGLPKDNVTAQNKGGNLSGSEGVKNAERGVRNAESKNTLPPGRVSASGDLRTRVEDLLIERMQNSPTLGQRITYYRAFLNVAATEKARLTLKQMLTAKTPRRGDVNRELKEANKDAQPFSQFMTKEQAETFRRGEETLPNIPLKTKDKFDILTRLLILGDADALRLLAELEKTETSDEAKRYAYAARAGIATAENKAKYWNDFVNNKEISESWIEAAFGPWNSIRHSELTLPYLQKALQELPNHKRNRKIFFVNGWLGSYIGGHRSEEALSIINKFLADNPKLDNDLRLKILENSDIIERAVKIRQKFGKN